MRTACYEDDLDYELDAPAGQCEAPRNCRELNGRQRHATRSRYRRQSGGAHSANGIHRRGGKYVL